MFRRLIALFAHTALLAEEDYQRRVHYFRTAGGTRPYAHMGYDFVGGRWVDHLD
jgi:hypothetical protein